MSYNGARPKVKRSTSVKHSTAIESQDNENIRSQEDESNEFDRRLSIRLYDVLDCVGASAECRKLRQDCSLSIDIINTMYHQFLHTESKSPATYIFGSSSEGTTIPSLNSDTDVLSCSVIPVVEHISEAGDGHSFVMFRDPHTQPGYVKLQFLYYGQPQTIHTRNIDRDLEESDSKGRICLKHQSLHGWQDERNGPADTDTKGNVDHVLGYRCSTIPEFANEWIDRHRQFKRPSKRMLKTMKNMGCFVVGVGHPTSKERTIEWRLSFSLQERQLMFSMNLVQHKCYIILKMIKKDLIEPIMGKSISSYHLKTCMFHTIENTKLNFWKRRNLTQCVLLCLCVLFNWVYIEYCPNYFITEENMFDRDIHRRQRSKLLHQIHLLLSHGCRFLFSIKLDNFGVHVKNGTKNVKTDPPLTKAMFGDKFQLLCSVLNFRRHLLCHGHDIIFTMLLRHVSHTKSIMDYNEKQTQEAFSYIKPYIHLQLAQSYASLAFKTSIPGESTLLLQTYSYFLREGRRVDQTSSILLEATVLIKKEQYERCIGILDELELVLNKSSFSICSCRYNSARRYYSPTQITQLNTLSVAEILNKTTTCIIFFESDLSITPEALHYEMFKYVYTLTIPVRTNDESHGKLFSAAEVDAVVYLHFMQYLVHAKLNRLIQKHAAIHKLESVLKCEEYLGHRETGYNLLGWIHFKENWIPRGLKYFKQSWAIRPHHNAAKLHMFKYINW